MHNHSTDSSVKVNTFQCRQLVIPIEVVQRVHDGTITIKQAYLLAIIDALVESRGVGCFASNGYLAKWLQTEPRQVHNILAPLIRDGLVKISESSTGGRLLETQWSRIAEDGNKLHGGSNKLHTPSKKLPKQACKKLPHIDSKSIDRGRTEPSTVPTPPEEFHFNGKFPISRNGKDAPDIQCLAWAKQLNRGLKDKGNIPYQGSISGKCWAEAFQAMRDTDHRKDILPILDFYVSHCDEATREELGLPEIRNAKEFRRHYGWIKDKMKKAGHVPSESIPTSNEPEQRTVTYKGQRWIKAWAEVYENHNCTWRNEETGEEVNGLHLFAGAVCEACHCHGGCEPDCTAYHHGDNWQEDHEIGRKHLLKKGRKK